VLVDDDADFRCAVAEHLRDDGHSVLGYQGPKALPVLETMVPPGVLLTDYQMDGENGLSLALRFHRVYPAVPIMLVTVLRTAHLLSEAAKWDFLHLLHKPLDYEILHETLHRLIVQARGR
jgi:DNA-binding NtrC family response regulator